MRYTKGNYPWEHYIIDDFLSNDRFEEILKNVETEKKYLDMFGYYSRSNHYYRFERFPILPELDQLFNELFPDESKGLSKINHYSIHPENHTYHTHVDNSSRIYSAVLYVAPSKNIGTIMCKNNSEFKDGHNKPDTENIDEVEIEFKPNRLFVHKSTNNTWHRYGASSQRVTINTFLVDKTMLDTVQLNNKYLIDNNFIIEG